MKLKDLFVGAAILGIALFVAYLWFSPSGLKEAPDLSVTTLDGGTMALSQLRGRPVLVTFWATSCPGCVKEMPHLVELYNALSPSSFEMVAIAMYYDPPEHVREMAQRRKLPYPVAMDTDGAAAKAFGEVQLTPTHFLIDPQGRIVQQTLGELDMSQLRARILTMLGSA